MLAIGCADSSGGTPDTFDAADLDVSTADVTDAEQTDADAATDALHLLDAADATPPPAPGPGLGNIEYTEEELFRPVAWVNHDTGIPGADPEILVTLVKPFGTNATVMHNGYLLTLFAPDSGSGPGGLLFYDVSDPRAPLLVNRVYDPHGTTAEFREAHSIGFGEIDGRQLAAFHTTRGIELWDLSNVHAPTPVSKLALPGVDGGDYLDVAWQLFWQGETIYVAGSTAGVYIVDVSDPDHPVLVDRGSGPNPVPPSELGGFRIGPIFAVGNVLIVSSMDDSGGFATIDISDPWNPSLLASRTRGLDEFYAICLAGGRIVTSTRGTGARMSVWDISDPFRIDPVDDSLLVPEQLYCAAQDEFVFQGAQHEVVKIDTSAPGDFRIVGRGSLGVPNPDHGQVTVFGNLVYVGNDHGTGSGLIPHQSAPDTTPPEVTMVSPADGEPLQSITSRIGLVFSDNVELSSIGADSIVVRPVGGEPLAGRYTAQLNIVNFQPSAPLTPDTTYEVFVPGGTVKDWAGNATAEEFRSRFTTGAGGGEADGPISLSVDPPPASLVGTTVTFRATVASSDEPMLSWNFGDETPWTTPSSGREVEHVFEEPGHYTVVVRATTGRSWAAASARVLAHEPLGDSRPSTSSSIASSPDGDRVYAVNRDGTNVIAVDTATHEVAFSTNVGAGAMGVAFGADDHVWVVARDDDVIARVDPETGEVIESIALPHGSRPVAVAADPAGRFTAVVTQGRPAVLQYFDDGEPTRTALEGVPGGIAIDIDGTIHVSRFRGPGDEGRLWTIPVDAAGLPSDSPSIRVLPPDTTTEDAEDRGRGVPNYIGAPAIRPGTTHAWLPATSANVFRGLARDGQPLNHENTVRAITPRLDLETGTLVGTLLDFNDRSLPVHIAFAPLGEWAWVTLQGSNEVVALDPWTGSLAGAITSAGHAPEATLVSTDGERLYVNAFLSRSLLVYDISSLARGGWESAAPVAEVPLLDSEPLAEAVLRGKRIFYNASDRRMSRDGYIACASCHLDGALDGLTWDFTDRGEGLRNTIDLRGRAGLGDGSLHWTANFDEVQDFENDIRLAFGGTGFLPQSAWSSGTTSDPLGDPKAGLSAPLDDLAAYVASLSTPPASPHRTDLGETTPSAEAGATIFADSGCTSCHEGVRYTDSGSSGATSPRHDVGTARDDSGGRLGAPLDGFDTPSLVGLWATAPYRHDGSATTLRDVFIGEDAGEAHDLSALAPETLDDLLAWLLSLE
jgi:DNA-binding beta-propeller fold protein YncE